MFVKRFLSIDKGNTVLFEFSRHCSYLLYPVSICRSCVLAPNAASRDRIVPGPQEVLAEGCAHAEQASVPRAVYRLPWARLLARVFRVDVTECPACGGKMKIIAALTDALAIRTYLDGVGLPSRAPPIAPSRRLPQTEFDYAC